MARRHAESYPDSDTAIFRPGELSAVKDWIWRNDDAPESVIVEIFEGPKWLREEVMAEANKLPCTIRIVDEEGEIKEFESSFSRTLSKESEKIKAYYASGRLSSKGSIAEDPGGVSDGPR
jgi:hypothetical protein